MAENSEKPSARNRGARFLLVAASAAIVVAGLRAAAPILAPLMVAVLLAILSSPLVDGLTRRSVPRAVAILAAVLANLALFAALLLPVAGSINAFFNQLPKYQRGLVDTVTSTIDYLDALGIDTTQLAWLEAWPQPEGLEQLGDELLGRDDLGGLPDRDRHGRPGTSRIGLESAVGVLTGTVRRLVFALTNVVLVLLILIFVLAESAALPRKLQNAMGWSPGDLEQVMRVKRDIQRYLVIKTTISLTCGVLVASWLALLKVDFPLLWGLVAFLCHYIPHIGTLLASLPPVILALISSGFETALAVAAGYVVINFVLGGVVEPHWMGRRFGLSTLVVFLSLLFWGWVWGPVGMFLSVPLTVMLKITLESTEDFRWLGLLLGAPPPAPLEASAVAGPAHAVVAEAKEAAP